MLCGNHIRERNLWIYKEFKRLHDAGFTVDETLKLIRKRLPKKSFRCNKNLRLRTIYNIVYGR